jgi:branched-chain amino acid transport system permease protein
MQFMLLLSVSIIIVNLCLLIAGPDTYGVQVDYMFDSYALGPFTFDAVRVYAALAALAIAVLLFLFFTRTRIGKSIRAAADNRMGALVVGLDVQRLYAFTFGVGAACVGAAGALMITIIPVTPFLAGEYTLLAFVIVIVGGLGSMTGALMGGLLIGVSEAVAGLLLQPSLKSMFSFGLLILVLLLRPQGLFGKSSS